MHLVSNLSPFKQTTPSSSSDQTLVLGSIPNHHTQRTIHPQIDALPMISLLTSSTALPNLYPCILLPTTTKPQQTHKNLHTRITYT